MCIFQNEGDLRCLPKSSFICNSDEEMISDDEEVSDPVDNLLEKENNMLSKFRHEEFQKVNPPSFGSDKQSGSYSWSEATKEAGELIYLNENAQCSSFSGVTIKANALCKGVRKKVKPKFSFRFLSRKEESSRCSVLKDEQDLSYKAQDVPEGLEPVSLRTAGHLKTELLEDFQGESTTDIATHGVVIGTETAGHGLSQHSMTDLLYGLQDKTCVPSSSSMKSHRTKGKRIWLPVEKSVLSLGERNINDEDLPEPLAYGTSSDDETKDQNLKPAITELRRKTMADQFHEVLGAACKDDDGLLFAPTKLSGCGLFGRLQQVMQTDKEIERDFTKKLQADATSSDEASYIDVKILSKYLDAKLTVCQCNFREHVERSLWLKNPQLAQENGKQKRTVIFNSRVCSDVDLEVGNLIRIHQPWKEVPVLGSDERVILSTYFSQTNMIHEERLNLKSQTSDQIEVRDVSLKHILSDLTVPPSFLL